MWTSRSVLSGVWKRAVGREWLLFSCNDAGTVVDRCFCLPILGQLTYVLKTHVVRRTRGGHHNLQSTERDLNVLKLLNGILF